MLACLFVGCAQHAAERFPITVRVESDPGVPLVGARVSAQGAVSPESDRSGVIESVLSGRAGDSVALRVSCPEGFRSPDKPLSALLRPLEERGRRPEFRVSCPPLARKLVVAVRADHGPNLPLRYLGQEIARTDGRGAAHALLTAAAGDTLTVTLDTSAATQLMPQNPELKVTLKERDDIVVFDQAFRAPKPPKPKPRKPPPPPEVPKRI
jgi:hypothetical protein